MKKTFLYLLIIFLIPATAYQSKSLAPLPASNNARQQVKSGNPPNIIFILADDLGWGELGSYGNTFNETPNLDILAAQGIRFTQAYAAAPVCSPTRASIMTGQWPARVGITDFLAPNSGRLLDPAKYVTINEALASRNYRTGLIGKWHLDTDFKDNKGGPARHGFHEVIGTETKYIADGDYTFPYDKIGTFETGAVNEDLTDRQNAEAVKFIQRNKQQPFFLYLSYYSVHTRLEAPEAVVQKYKKKFDAKYGAGKANSIYGADGKKRQANHTDNPYLAAMLDRIDSGVGNIMAELEKQGLAENTLVVFFSDNGGANNVGNNAHLRMSKTWLYEGGIRDCLLMRWPAKIKSEQTTDVPVSSIDFYPTFVDAAQGKMPAGYQVDGISLLPLLTKGKLPKRDTFYWHYPAETGKWENRMSSMVRKGNYKLIEFYANPRLELYDLKADPSEKKDLCTAMPEKVKELKKMLDAWKKEVNAQPAVIAEK